ncbi:hypothetical protein N782_09310 [Pontibacillus yanchengensis Y32]|uniref:Uncharacterized protein n=2 Tax=Pontibacillus yanchengensis TaxID=462910 RepID=A0A0A2TJK4_9BACI|nr:hypothetical protein N782_09310 [Pontibacillus yanchengensis Y32]
MHGMTKTLERRREEMLDEGLLLGIMQGINQKVENQEIVQDAQLIDEVIDSLKPLYGRSNQ